jgi:hypothetical protein
VFVYSYRPYVLYPSLKLPKLNPAAHWQPKTYCEQLVVVWLLQSMPIITSSTSVEPVYRYMSHERSMTVELAGLVICAAALKSTSAVVRPATGIPNIRTSICAGYIQLYVVLGLVKFHPYVPDAKVWTHPWEVGSLAGA